MSPKSIFRLLPLVLLTACGSAGMHDEPDNKSFAPMPKAVTSADSTTGIVANESITSPLRKIIRTADFHCKVQNVFKATTQLEQLVRLAGGIVQESHIENASSEIKTTYFKPDSLRQTQTYTTTSLLTLRVPSANLDSIIQAIPGMSCFIDSRTLKQSDVTYQYLANDLKNKEEDSKKITDKALQLAKKSKEPLEIQQYENNLQEQKISRTIENLQMMDDVTYATITVEFSQPEEVYVQTIVNPEYITSAPFATQCKAAIYSGWSIVREFTIVIIDIWPLLIILIVSWLALRKIQLRKIALAKK